MNGINELPVKVLNGSLYLKGNRIIEMPSLLIDGDVVLKYGDYNLVLNYFEILVKVYMEGGLDIKEMSLIQFDKYSSPYFTVEDICYILNRCIEFTGTGFASKLRILWGTEEFLDWLKCEENKFPLI